MPDVQSAIARYRQLLHDHSEILRAGVGGEPLVANVIVIYDGALTAAKLAGARGGVRAIAEFVRTVRTPEFEDVAALAGSGTPLSILTKGTLLRRDLALLAEASEHMPVDIGRSIAIYDEGLQQSVEPGTPTAKARLAARPLPIQRCT